MATYQQVRRLAKKAPQGYGRSFESVASEELNDSYKYDPARVWADCRFLNYPKLYIRVKAGLHHGYDMFEDEWSVLATCTKPACTDWRFGQTALIRLLAYIENRAARHGIDLVN